jgi:hypothetical protein
VERREGGRRERRCGFHRRMDYGTCGFMTMGETLFLFHGEQVIVMMEPTGYRDLERKVSRSKANTTVRLRATRKQSDEDDRDQLVTTVDNGYDMVLSKHTHGDRLEARTEDHSWRCLNHSLIATSSPYRALRSSKRNHPNLLIFAIRGTRWLARKKKTS